MEWLLWLFIGAAIVSTVLTVGRLTIRRYHRHTFPDSEAPGGRRTNWRGFWGRKS